MGYWHFDEAYVDFNKHYISLYIAWAVLRIDCWYDEISVKPHFCLTDHMTKDI